MAPIQLYRDPLGILYLHRKGSREVYFAEESATTFDKDCQALDKGALDQQRIAEMSVDELASTQLLAVWRRPGVWVRDAYLTRPHPILGNLEPYLTEAPESS